ncbi:MAG: ABATE domain-containing protein, partial [Gaiellaceae bacterium]
MDTSRAPGELELVRVFVNTLEVDEAVDELSSPAALTGWLRAQGLL